MRPIPPLKLSLIKLLFNGPNHMRSYVLRQPELELTSQEGTNERHPGEARCQNHALSAVETAAGRRGGTSPRVDDITFHRPARCNQRIPFCTLTPQSGAQATP